MLPRFVGRGLTPLGMFFIAIGHGRSPLCCVCYLQDNPRLPRIVPAFLIPSIVTRVQPGLTILRFKGFHLDAVQRDDGDLDRQASVSVVVVER
jgi:hypothetical protein